MEGGYMGGLGRGFMAFVCFFLFLMAAGRAVGKVVLVGRNVSLTFDDVEANFAPPIRGSGICGTLHMAKPYDACSRLTNYLTKDGETNASFVLIVRGNCTFDEKVKNAQSVGFKAVIVYDDQDSGVLVPMSGESRGVHIPAVFVSKASGEVLKKYVNDPDVELWIIPAFENSAWSILAISFICFLAISAVLGVCYFVKRHSIRRERPREQIGRDFHGMSRQSVKAIPSLVFTTASDENCTSMTCAICLDDYNVGDKLRVLPCHHKFHASCVDLWLTSWRTFCPVCKRDARTISGGLPASETTPLLSSAVALPVSSSRFSSFHSSVGVSSAIQIGSPSRSHSIGIGSQSSGFNVRHSIRSYGYSPGQNASRSSFDFRNASSLRSQASFAVSPHSLGFSSPINSRQSSMYIPSSSHATPTYLGSSSRQTFLRHCSESAESFSPFASAQSLPGC